MNARAMIFHSLRISKDASEALRDAGSEPQSFMGWAECCDLRPDAVSDVLGLGNYHPKLDMPGRPPVTAKGTSKSLSSLIVARKNYSTAGDLLYT
jgi:hypothetical protein